MASLRGPTRSSRPARSAIEPLATSRPDLRSEPEAGSIARPPNVTGHVIVVPRLPGVARAIVVNAIRVAVGRFRRGTAGCEDLRLVEWRDDVLAEAQIAIRRLHLVKPFVDEALFRMRRGQVRAPVVRDDGTEARSAGLVAGPDRAAPAAQLQGSIGRPDGQDGIDRSSWGMTRQLWRAVSRGHPGAPS